MPRGAKPGERRGGRGKGAKNVKTLLKEITKEVVGQELRKTAVKGHKRAVEVLSELMHVTYGLAGKIQQQASEASARGLPFTPVENDERFWKCVDVAAQCAARLAPFQNPTFRAVALMNEAPPPDNTAQNLLDLQAVKDPQEATQVYLRLIRADPNAA